MKRVSSALCAVVLLIVLAAGMVMPVEAVDMEFNFRGTVGEMAYFIVMSDVNDEIVKAKVYNGVIPGMELDVAGGVTLGVVGTPTSEGEFSIFVTLVTKNMGEQDVQINVTIYPAPVSEDPPSDGTPKITKHPTDEKVVAGDSAVFIARAENVRQYNWVIAIADAEIDCKDLEIYLGGKIKVSGYNTERLELKNIPDTLNDAYVWCRFVGAEETVSSNAAKISVVSAKDATPVVTKHPTDETVVEGGEAVFIAKAKYAQSYLWRLVSPNGIKYDCVNAPDTFKGLEVYGADTERIVLKNIPIELNGYRIYCRFTAGDTISSDMAKLIVKEKPAETEPPTNPPTQPPTEAPTQAPTTPPTEKPTEAPENVYTEQNTHIPENTPDNDQTDKGGGSTTLILVAIISATIVAVAGIAAFVILKLKGPNRNS